MGDKLNVERFLGRLKRLHAGWTKGEQSMGGGRREGVLGKTARNARRAFFHRLLPSAWDRSPTQGRGEEFSLVRARQKSLFSKKCWEGENSNRHPLGQRSRVRQRVLILQEQSTAGSLVSADFSARTFLRQTRYW